MTDGVVFNEGAHTYTRDKKTLISVTQLMRKHGLSPDYSGVNAGTLNMAAERGTLIHSEIERYIKHGELGFTDEQADFIRLAEELGLKDMRSEVLVANDFVAGTLDLMAVDRDGKKMLADFKTTTTLHRAALSWQLSLYERLSGETFDKFLAFHLLPDGKSKYIAIDRVSAEEVDRLLECEKNGKPYTPKSLIVESDVLESVKAAQNEIARLDEIKKAADERLAELKAELLKSMEAQNIRSYETPDKSMLITYIAATTRQTVDKKALERDCPDIAKKYTKTSKINPTVKITLREG